MEFGECFFAHAGAVGAEAALITAGSVATDPPVGHFVPSEPSFGVIKDAPVPDFVGFIIVEEVVDAAERAQVFRGGGPAGSEGLDVVDFAAHGRHPVGNNDAGALPKVSGIVGVFPVFDVFEFGEVITVEHPPY